MTGKGSVAARRATVSASRAVATWEKILGERRGKDFLGDRRGTIFLGERRGKSTKDRENNKQQKDDTASRGHGRVAQQPPAAEQC